MEKQQPFYSMSALRIYLRSGDNRKSYSWWERVFEKPLSTHIVHAALKAGIVHAAVTLGHMGFTKDSKAVASGNTELPMHTLPVCVELLASKRLLEQFIRQEIRHLKGTTMVMVDGVHLSSLYLSDLETGAESDEHTVEYITGEDGTIRIDHVGISESGEEAVG